MISPKHLTHTVGALTNTVKGLVSPIRPAADAMFDSSSGAWKLDRQWFMIFGGQRALMMQLAHPKVAAGVAQFSDYDQRPFDRLEGTLTSMLAISFGSEKRREETLERLRRVHSVVKGTTETGEQYTGNDPDLQLWVWATLVDTIFALEKRFVGDYDAADRDAYYLQSRQMPMAFGVPDEMIPATYAEFQVYVADMIAEFEISDEGRSVLTTILDPQVGVLPPAVFAPLKWITFDITEDILREKWGYKSLTPVERQLVNVWLSSFRLANRVLPDFVFTNPLTSGAIRAA